MEKSFAVESVETIGEAGSGKFEARVSVFGNVDAVKDVVMPTAFDKAINESEPPPVVWSHFWQIPPIGNTIDWSVDGKGLRVQGELFVGADDKHQYADMVYAAMKSRDGRKPALREFSFSYDIPEGGMLKATREKDDGLSVAVQELHTIFPVYEVGPCLKGCNPETQILTAPKQHPLSDEERETLEKIEALAKRRAMQLQEFIRQLDEEGQIDEKALNALKTELLLAYPDH